MARNKKTSLRGAREVRVKGSLQASHVKITIIVAEFNEYFTTRLLDGALDTLYRHGAKPANIRVIHVPGAFEIPIVVQKVLTQKRADAIITLGMVIKGETRHFEHVVDASAKGTLQAALENRIPVIHAVIAAENLQQAIDRTGGKIGNKGRDAAKAAIEMANVMKAISK